MYSRLLGRENKDKSHADKDELELLDEEEVPQYFLATLNTEDSKLMVEETEDVDLRKVMIRRHFCMLLCPRKIPVKNPE